MATYKPLTVKQQIKVLRSAKALYVKRSKSDIDINCMCYCIANVIEKQRNIFNIWCIEIPEFIPIFNADNVEAAGIKGLIPLIEKNEGYWWDVENKTIRPLVFDWLISELEKQIIKK